MREEKEKLVQELTRVKDKYRTSEVERSRLQTQVRVSYYSLPVVLCSESAGSSQVLITHTSVLPVDEQIAILW